jgi:formylglycine-generating enzyme required for sulfatase activity
MLRAAVVVLSIALLPSLARAEGRIALLIGNQLYNPKVGPLKNPHDDVALVGAALRSLGFTVTELRDADYRSMDAAIKRHAAAVRREGQGTISLFYYSGHGAADPDTRTNYLIPTDVEEADDTDLWNYSLNLNKIVESLREQAPAATHYVVFDACRNELNLTRKGQKALADKGFVPLAYTPGVMVAYSTAPGKTAADTGSGGGPYAKVLAEELVKPGIEAMTMFRHVALRVNREIGQDPWMSASTLPEVYFAGAPAVGGTASASMSAAAEAWAAARETSDPTVLEAFIARFKDSFYADLARSRLKALTEQRDTMATPPTPPAPGRSSAGCVGVEITVGQNERRCFKPGAGKTEQFKDCPSCPEMVVVPSGHFTMGSPESEPEHVGFESPQHEVTIGKPFAVGRFAVTRGEFATFVKEAEHNTAGGCNTSGWFLYSDKSWRSPGFDQDDRHPVVCVNWGDARAFVVWLSKKTGKAYRLLSEAEREYVARAGTTTPFWWGSAITPKQANYDGSADPYTGGGSKGVYPKRTVAVDSFEANPWGLYDVHGNVWDLTEDCWNANYQGAPADGSAWTSGDCTKRMLRGGSWSDVPRGLRSAVRLWDFERNNKQGFRLARTLSP